MMDLTLYGINYRWYELRPSVFMVRTPNVRAMVRSMAIPRHTGSKAYRLTVYSLDAVAETNHGSDYASFSEAVEAGNAYLAAIPEKNILWTEDEE